MRETYLLSEELIIGCRRTTLHRTLS